MLTVRYDVLGVGSRDRLLDLGSGGGRHAFEAMRRGAVVTALDADGGEIKNAYGLLQAIAREEPGATALGGSGTAVVADARALPFRPGAFDRVIAAEVLEHVPEDGAALSELVRVLRSGGTMAVTVPRFWPERILWALSDEYHQVPGGHIRIYRRSVLLARMRRAGLVAYGAHHAHALHSPYWWLRALVGVRNESHGLVRAYHRFLVWDITAAPRLTRLPERWLNPILGKSFVIYGRKPA
jgi:SAM-dependent methyltransferase